MSRIRVRQLRLRRLFIMQQKKQEASLEKSDPLKRDISLMLWLLILWKIHGYRLQQKSVWSDSVI